MTLGNQSASQLQMGASEKGAPPSPRGDEDPPWDWEAPPQLLQEHPGVSSNDIYHSNHHIHINRANPPWAWEAPVQLAHFLPPF